MGGDLVQLSEASLRRLSQLLRADKYSPFPGLPPGYETNPGTRHVRIARTTTNTDNPTYPSDPANTYVVELGQLEYTETPGNQTATFTPYDPAQYRIARDWNVRYLDSGTVVAIELHHNQWHVVDLVGSGSANLVSHRLFSGQIYDSTDTDISALASNHANSTGIYYKGDSTEGATLVTYDTSPSWGDSIATVTNAGVYLIQLGWYAENSGFVGTPSDTISTGAVAAIPYQKVGDSWYAFGEYIYASDYPIFANGIGYNSMAGSRGFVSFTEEFAAGTEIKILFTFTMSGDEVYLQNFQSDLTFATVQ